MAADRPSPNDLLSPQNAYTRLILESIGDGVIVTDSSGRVTFMNLQAQRLTGWFDESGLGRPFAEVFTIVNSQTRKVCSDPVAKVLVTGGVVGLANHTTLIARDGNEYQIADSAAPVKDSTGNVHGVILVFRDVTEEYERQEAVRRSEERFRRLFEHSINAVALHEIILDEAGQPVDYRFLEVNRAFERLTGLRAEELVGRTVLEVLPNTEPFWIQTYGKVALTGEPCELEDYSQELGKYFTVRAYSPEPGQFVAVFEDVTARRTLENRLREMAFTDSLTGLHNRHYLETNLQRFYGEDSLPLSVIAGDVNGLKIINDSMGHRWGDEVLRQVAQILKEVTRPEDVVVRWGGDEFVLLLPRTTAEEAQAICSAIHAMAAARSRKAVMVSIALGCATKTDLARTMEEVMRRAETNMYHHKMSTAQSRRSAMVFSLRQAMAEKSHETEEHARNLQRLAVSLAQRVGLSEGEIVTVSLVALLHDIGKVAISERLLDKPGPLTEEEWALMKQHAEIGYRIVASSADLLDVAQGVLHHHERWDGKGYPTGLKGTDIPIAARIVALADSFDAMTNDRAYRARLSWDEAKAEIAACAGSQFDPELAAEFLAMLQEQEALFTASDDEHTHI
ncbi:MAG: diguanylate cyclase [Firmicutes bacterium]|jgi:diguanylate cyclase (GGDEF)-like protein/PAS domain S-box-containing protein|nr:diguanylate cyclase [Bacillota bacterium]